MWNFTQTVLTVLFTGVLCGTEVLAGHVYCSMKILPSIFLHYEGR